MLAFHVTHNLLLILTLTSDLMLIDSKYLVLLRSAVMIVKILVKETEEIKQCQQKIECLFQLTATLISFE